MSIEVLMFDFNVVSVVRTSLKKKRLQCFDGLTLNCLNANKHVGTASDVQYRELT